jgi:hypothetical protein
MEMKSVIIDFSETQSLSTCPIWWRGFISSLPKSGVNGVPHDVLVSELEKYNGILHDGVAGLIEAIEFKSQEDFDTFRLIWILHGE